MSRRRPAPARFVLAAALGAVAAGVVLPDRLRIDHRFPVVDAAAWRPHSAVATLVGAAVLAAARRTRPAAVAVGAVGVAGLAAVVGRGVRRPAPAAGPGATERTERTELTILTANVLKGRADTGALAALLAREGPDLVVLPEAGQDFRDKLMPLVEVLGYRSWVSCGPGTADQWAVTLLAGPRAGDLRVRRATGMRLPHLEATGGILGPRTLHAVHATAPMYPRFIAAWRRDLELVGRWCRGEVAPIVAGDLNATFDHAALRSVLGPVRSAADGTGRGLVGTFPVALPRWLGIQIDHVLVPAAAVTTRFEVVDVEGSDHRGVLVRLLLDLEEVTVGPPGERGAPGMN